MFRFMNSESSGKGKQSQQIADGKMEVHIETEVHSTPLDTDGEGFQALGSTSSLATTPSSVKRPLPPGLRVPTHPYPWHHHTPASSSQSSIESPVTPSHVSWLGPGAGGSSTSRAASSSAPNLQPYFPPPPPTAPPANVSRARPLLPSKSTHSLRPAQEYFGQPLSPIVEQDYMSPENRPVSLPSSQEGSGSTGTMLTPISPSMITPTSTFTMNEMMAHTTPTPTTPVAPPQFAKRREDELPGDSPRSSISMSSIRTHHSGNSLSATPPVIPPLDLRPQFPGPLPQDSLLSRDIVDEALGIHDDESTKRESFVTAPSAYAPRESRYSAMLLDLEYEPLDEEELSSNQPSDSSHDYEHSTLRLPQAARTHSPTRPVSRTSTHPPSYSFPHPHVDHGTEVRTPSMRSLDSAKRSSSFIDRRFEESELYLGSHTECSSARQASDKWAKQTENSDTAKTLFWVGFIAPWCWLIGGWLVKAKKNDRYTRGGAMLPLWTGKNAALASWLSIRGAFSAEFGTSVVLANGASSWPIFDGEESVD
ncbi:hypothetical protein M405DRAFT_837240 [Rhizopogon salebrosus TDB-379]|nr:hypothetical protein M405DRAFT_837240 [Rhizopogon salebrosus TDB-379]